MVSVVNFSGLTNLLDFFHYIFYMYDESKSVDVKYLVIRCFFLTSFCFAFFDIDIEHHYSVIIRTENWAEIYIID